jgi:hypothetical protein
VLLIFGAAVAKPAAAAPRLVVLITVEQLRSDALQRYGADFGQGGFRLLQQGGAVFPRCRVDALPTLAAPSAATLATGAPPATHGIVGARWYDSQIGAVVEAVRAASSEQPTRLVGSTLADELMLSTDGRSRVIAVSGSAAPAVLQAGRHPAGCYWRGSDGFFQTSTYYSGVLPEWVQAVNRNLQARQRSIEWRAVGLEAPAPALRLIAGPDFDALYRASPFAAEDVFELAAAALESNNLGGRRDPDLLLLNVTAPAMLGLETGAYSPLMRDMLRRLDQSLAVFLTQLDNSIGLENAAVVLTGLHGLPPHDDDLRRGGLSGGPVEGKSVAGAVDSALRERFGWVRGVERYVYPALTLASLVGELAPAERRQAIEVAGRAALAVDGVVGYYSPDASHLPAPFVETFQRSFFRGRSGDLMLLYGPYRRELYGDGRGLSSGSPYRYDNDVPLILFGPRFRPGVYESDVASTSVAPTLAAVLGISPPNSASGPVLSIALSPDSLPAMGPPRPAAQ